MPDFQYLELSAKQRFVIDYLIVYHAITMDVFQSWMTDRTKPNFMTLGSMLESGMLFHFADHFFLGRAWIMSKAYREYLISVDVVKDLYATPFGFGEAFSKSADSAYLENSDVEGL